jgi:hypothetical protein
MPRSTSGMAVSMESELVTLPSSPSLRSTLYRGSRLSKRSACACAFALLPVGCAPALALALALVPAPAAAAGVAPVPSPVSAACCSGPRRSLMFSSMYAILHGVSQLSRKGERELRVKRSAHVLVHVERIGLLRKVVRAHSAPHLGRFVLWLPNKCREPRATEAAKRPFFYSEPDSSADTCAPGCNPPAGISSPSSDLRRRFFFASPLVSLDASIPCRARRNLRSSRSSETLLHSGAH